MSNKNNPKGTNKSADSKNKGQEAPLVDGQENKAPETSGENNEANLGDGLEDADDKPEGSLSMHKPKEGVTPEFENREWLENNSPADHINDETKSSKYDETREATIMEGIVVMSTIKLMDNDINPLLLLLAKWWEVKPARSAIKKMIDEEAKNKGFEADVYMQVELAKQVDALHSLQSAIDRMRYAKTYYKPRKPLSTSVPTKIVTIDGELYIVPIAELEKAKTQFGEDREGMVKHIISVSTKKENDVETL